MDLKAELEALKALVAEDSRNYRELLKRDEVRHIASMAATIVGGMGGTQWLKADGGWRRECVENAVATARQILTEIRGDRAVVSSADRTVDLDAAISLIRNRGREWPNAQIGTFTVPIAASLEQHREMHEYICETLKGECLKIASNLELLRDGKIQAF